MTDELKPMQGDVLAPNARIPATHGPRTPPPSVGGPAFWVKRRYNSAREKAEAYTDFLRSLTDTVEVTERLERAIERRDAGLARLERLDDLRAAEHRKIDREIESVGENITAQRLVGRATLAALEEDALVAEQRLARLRSEPPPTTKTQDIDESPARRAANEIKLRRQEHADIIREMREAAGETWSQADEDVVQRMELALGDRINRLIEEMRDQ